MKILLTGGGTGGHITPLLAVSRELKSLKPDCTVIYVGERGGRFDELTRNCQDIDASYRVFAGKFRRYHGESWLMRILDIKTIFMNLRDVVRVFLGIFEAIFLLRKLKPDVVFLKGGFVGVPIGLAAALLHIPTVTHDSDALPGLANRMVGRWAKINATALPANYYPYAASKVRHVGVLVEHNYKYVDQALQAEYKQQLGFSKSAQVLLITGGSTGAERINKGVVGIIDRLLAANASLQVIHQVGKGKTGVYGDYKHSRLNVLEFLNPMYVFMGAADLVIARASGNTVAELGTQGKAAIIIPNPDLTGGHQLKNAERLAGQGAAFVLPENLIYDEATGLLATITKLLGDLNLRQRLASRLQEVTSSDAANKLASILFEQGAKKL